MKHILYMIIIFVIALSFCFSELIAEELVIVRVNANYSPYEMVIDGKLTGLHIDLVNAIAQQLSIDINFQSVPWKRAIKLIKEGTADAITYIGKTPEREQFIHFNIGNILSSSEYGFIVLKDKADKILYNGDLRGMTSDYNIGVLRGYSYGSDFDNADYLKKQIVDKSKQLLGLLLKGRIDLAIIDKPEYLQNRNNEQWLDITFLNPPIVKRDFYIGFSKAKKHEHLTLKFAEKLTAFKKTDGYIKILTKYKLN